MVHGRDGLHGCPAPSRDWPITGTNVCAGAELVIVRDHFSAAVIAKDMQSKSATALVIVFILVEYLLFFSYITLI